MLAKKAFNDPKIRRNIVVLYKKSTVIPVLGTGTKKVLWYFCTWYCPPMPAIKSSASGQLKSFANY